jgi:hypothetical protein
LRTTMLARLRGADCTRAVASDRTTGGWGGA